MTIEEKARAYDEAKARIMAAYNSNRCTLGFMNEIFSEIKESKDERIRKALIQHIAKISTEIPVGALHRINGVDIPDILSWLEKQVQPKWTEEDETITQCIIADVKYAKLDHLTCADAPYNPYDKKIAWLNSLEERFK